MITYYVPLKLKLKQFVFKVNKALFLGGGSFGGGVARIPMIQHFVFKRESHFCNCRGFAGHFFSADTVLKF